MDNPRLTQIKTKLSKLKELDKNYQIFGSEKHKYILNPPLRDQELQAFEMQYGLTLPEEYKTYLTQLGNGGVGPYYGLLSLESGIQAAESISTEENQSILDSFNQEFSFSNQSAQKFMDYYNQCLEEGDDDEIEYLEIPDPFTGVIVLADYGCGWNYVLVVKGQQAGKIWMTGEYLSPCFYGNKALGFLDWYEDWLNRSLEELSPSVAPVQLSKDKKIVNYDGWKLKEIPSEVFEYKDLKKLVFSRNDLTELPKAIFQFKKLRTLDLSMTPIVEIPAQISEFQELKRLKLNYNYHLTLPDTLDQLKNLQELSMYYNYKIVNIPEVVARISSLKHLRFSNCAELKSLPKHIGNLKNLESLQLNDCDKLENLPDSIVNLTNLKSLYLGQTKIRKLPEKFENLQNLEFLGLDIAELDLEDTMQKINKLPKLQFLKLTNQYIYPQALSQLKSLKTLVITQNYTLWHQGAKTLPIPEQVGFIPNLETLDLMNNNQADSLPTNIGNLSKLKELELSATSIKEFPESLEKLSHLEKIQGSLESNRESPFGIRPEAKAKVVEWFPQAKIWVY